MSSMVIFFPFEEYIVSFSNSFGYFLVKIYFAVFVNGCTSLLLWSIFLECLFFHPLPWSNANSWCCAILFVYNRRIDYVLASILFACVFYWWTEVIVINTNEEWWLTPCMLSLFLLLVVMLRCVCVCFPFFAANTTLFTIYYYLLFTISVFMCIINLFGLDSSFPFFLF